MRRAADLHIHSRHSIATSSKLTPPYLDRWARVKGLDLMGTGDCTHPAWLAELGESLEPAAEGLFRLKPELRQAFDAGEALAENLPEPGTDREPRFVLTGEISTIYSRGGRTRKVHHLVILPDFEAARAFQARLARVGNIASDGRPILGLDSRDLFSLLLDSDPRAILVPAHIWTPWFSALGERSGFDSIEECYRDLASRIAAIETGLSSNPPMNWAVGSLDRFAIISNSDAHSPEKLGREATILDMEDSWKGLAQALAGGGPAGRILETVEFFPQEGKYHADGHRACRVVRMPGEGPEGPCPVCGKPLTPGVLGRVARLADRPLDESAPCPADCRGTNRRPYRSLVPLKEILAELIGTGEGSKAVAAAYAALVREAGSELGLLLDLDRHGIEALRAPGVPGELLAEAVERVRSGLVRIRPGYDGEYGEIRLFAPGERFEPRAGAGLFGPPEAATTAPARRPRRAAHSEARTIAGPRPPAPERPAEGPFVPDPDQELAVSHPGGPALVLAGPGTGKTTVLIRRIARVLETGADPSSILALTFTSKAARDLRDRLERNLGPGPAGAVTASTFHAFCLSLLREHSAAAGLPADFCVLGPEEREVLLGNVAGRRAGALGTYAEGRKRRLLLPGEDTPRLGPGARAALAEALAQAGPPGEAPFNPDLESLYADYRARLKAAGALDFDDLPAGAVRLLSARPEILSALRDRYRRIYVDEYQDVNLAQYALVRILAPPESFPDQGSAGLDPETPGVPAELLVIGDPDQSIYSFRGADPRFIARFRSDYPGARIYSLARSRRCAPAILGAAGRLSGRLLEGEGTVALLERNEAPTDKSEAEGIARRIDRLIGGTRFFALDSGTAGGEPAGTLRCLSECAILVRTAAQFPALEKALGDHAIPYVAGGARPWWEEDPSYLKGPAPGEPGEEDPARGVPAGPRGEAVRLLTVHAAKGLEFDYVFVAGLEEGLFPFTQYEETTQEDLIRARIEEERRLLYVAVTRARIGLSLWRARARTFRGRRLALPPSRFLAEIEDMVPTADKDRGYRRDPQRSLFPAEPEARS